MNFLPFVCFPPLGGSPGSLTGAFLEDTHFASASFYHVRSLSLIRRNRKRSWAWWNLRLKISNKIKFTSIPSHLFSPIFSIFFFRTFFKYCFVAFCFLFHIQLIKWLGWNWNREMRALVWCGLPKFFCLYPNFIYSFCREWTLRLLLCCAWKNYFFLRTCAAFFIVAI